MGCDTMTYDYIQIRDEPKVYDIIMDGKHRFIRARSYMQIAGHYHLDFMDVFSKGKIANKVPYESEIEDISNR